jgi:hypothetical protein
MTLLLAQMQRQVKELVSTKKILTEEGIQNSKVFTYMVVSA